MSPDRKTGTPVFQVIDAMKAPHTGQILRVRHSGGKTPSLRDIKGATLKARSPEGVEATVNVVAFAMIGGKPSEARFNRTGRLDLVIDPGTGDTPVGLRWILEGPS